MSVWPSRRSSDTRPATTPGELRSIGRDRRCARRDGALRRPARLGRMTPSARSVTAGRQLRSAPGDAIEVTPRSACCWGIRSRIGLTALAGLSADIPVGAGPDFPGRRESDLCRAGRGRGCVRGMNRYRTSLAIVGVSMSSSGATSVRCRSAVSCRYASAAPACISMRAESSFTLESWLWGWSSGWRLHRSRGRWSWRRSCRCRRGGRSLPGVRGR